MRRAGIYVLVAGALLASRYVGLASQGDLALQDDVAAQAGAAAREDERVAGVALELRSASDGAARVVRSARLVALRVAPGTAPSGLVAPGAFTATFRGSIIVPLRDRYTFSFEGVGAARLEVGTDVVFDFAQDATGTATSVRTAAKPTRLRKGENSFVLTYASRPDGEGACRLLWEGFGIARELVPPTVLVHARDEAEARGNAALAGRALVAQRQCTTCHALGASIEPKMLELRRRGFRLDGVASRYTTAFLTQWVLDPRSLRRTARMPAVLTSIAESERPAAAADLAAWLATLRDPELERLRVPDGDAKRGGELFAQLGCIACHTRPDAPAAASAEDDGRIELRHLRFQWTSHAALSAFLLAPETHDRWIRMPKFGFTEDEAAHVARFLWERAPVSERAAPPLGDAVKGRELARRLRCAACHVVEDEVVAAFEPASPWVKVASRLGGGAEAGGASCSAADFHLSKQGAAALQAFVMVDAEARSFGAAAEAEYFERQVEELRCTACHVYDGRIDDQSRYASEVADIAKAPDKDEVDQLRPELTWLGEKLRSEWVTKFLNGEVASPRPWLHARMPRFRSRARMLADGMAAMHGLDVSKKSEIEAPREDLARVGARIVGSKGHACTTCHAVGKSKATMVFESPGINLALASERLRQDFYLRWMLDPQRFDKRTKMTKFADEKGRTALDFFEGDARAQFEALWQYLLEGSKLRPPDETAR